MTDEPPGLVRLRARITIAVRVRVRQTFSGLKLKVTAAPRGAVGSNWR
jgi:hypothetical protein